MAVQPMAQAYGNLGGGIGTFGSSQRKVKRPARRPQQQRTKRAGKRY